MQACIYCSSVLDHHHAENEADDFQMTVQGVSNLTVLFCIYKFISFDKLLITTGLIAANDLLPLILSAILG